MTYHVRGVVRAYLPGVGSDDCELSASGGIDADGAAREALVMVGLLTGWHCVWVELEVQEEATL